MADQAINALSTKTAPETSDQLLLVGAGEPQLIDYDKLADAILNKITSKNYALDAGTMTLPAALNALNGKSLINLGNVDVGIDTLKIYSNGTTIKLIVKWENTLHAIVFDTNNRLYIQTSTDSGSTWKTIREI